QTRGDVANRTVFQHDAALDLAILDYDVVVNAGERADVAVDDLRVFPDDRRAAHHAVHDLCAALDRHAAVHLGAAVDIAVHVRLKLVQHVAVGGQHIVGAPGVDPPALVDVRVDRITVVDQPLDRVGDLQLPTERGLNLLGRLEDVLVKHVDPDQRQ